MHMQGADGHAASQNLGRRGFMAALLTAVVAGSSVIGAPGSVTAEGGGAKAFELVPTTDEKWALGGFTENGETELINGLASCDVVFLGEHHNQARPPSTLDLSQPRLHGCTDGCSYIRGRSGREVDAAAEACSALQLLRLALPEIANFCEVAALAGQLSCEHGTT